MTSVIQLFCETAFGLRTMKSIPFALVTLIISFHAHAGAWGEGSFDNDDALDWVTECTQSKGIGMIAKTLETALQATYIKAPDGSSAVAAAEVVAAALGRPNPAIPPELSAWIKQQPLANLAQLTPLARRALARIQDPKLSELKQLWSESTPSKWPAAIVELDARLGR